MEFVKEIVPFLTDLDLPMQKGFYFSNSLIFYERNKCN